MTVGAGEEDAVITDSFESRTLANMEVALERACRMLPAAGDKHTARRIIATGAAAKFG